MKYFQSVKRLKISSSFMYFDLIHDNLLKQTNSITNICLQLFSNTVDPKISNETTKEKSKTKTATEKPKSKSSALEQLEKEPYFQEVKDLIPESIFKPRKTGGHALYLINKDTAYEMLFPILPYLQTPSAGESTLIEINPGLGYLTDLLLNNWSREITLYESNAKFYKAIQERNDAHASRINLVHSNFYDIWKLSYQDQHSKSRKVDSLMNNIKPIPWGKEFCTTMIGIAPSDSFINHLIISLMFQYSLMLWGRHQLFLVMSPRDYIRYTCDRTYGYGLYRAPAIMFQILFEFKILCKLPRKSFLPWYKEPKRTRKFQKLQNIDSEFLYLVRIEPRKNLYDLCKSQDLKLLWYFIRQNLLSRKSRIIPTLELLVPNCGPKLITMAYTQRDIIPKKTMNINGFDIAIESDNIYEKDFYPNLTIFTEFGDLNPSQILSLFIEFISWPEFSESPFISSMDNFLLKFENTDEILGVEDEDEHLEENENE